MKYIILTLAALAVSIAVSVIITRLLTGKKKPKPVFRAIIVIILAVVLFFAIAMIYLSIYYRADEDALKYLKSTENVTVTKTDTAWFFTKEHVTIFRSTKEDFILRTGTIILYPPI